MSTVLMIKSNLDGNVIDIERKSTSLDAYPPTVGTPSLDGPSQFAANQSWEIQADPAGSSHHIIKNPATNHCIEIQGNSVSPGAALVVSKIETKNNESQLWDFLPDPFGSGSCFIQNPQTGYVIEILDASTTRGKILVVNPRRLFANNHQLWSAVNEEFTAVALPSLSMAPLPSGELNSFGSNNQYVLLPPNQNTNFKAVTVTVDIIEDLVADSFAIQINCNAPTPADGAGALWDAQWVQLALQMQNNTLFLWNQAWHAQGPDQPGDPLHTLPGISGTLLQLENNIIPARTRIVLELIIDPTNDYATGLTAQAYQPGAAIGTPPVTLSFLNQTGVNAPNKVTEADFSPLGALSIVLVGAPTAGGTTNLVSGLGTLTVNCNPKATAQSSTPNPHGIGTQEQSNCYYGQVQQGSFSKIVQPFGVLSPKLTNASGSTTVSGTGLFPNSELTVKATYTSEFYPTTKGVIYALGPSHVDGSFSFYVEPSDPVANKSPGTLSATVTDKEGNSAQGEIAIGGFAELLDTSGTPRSFF